MHDGSSSALRKRPVWLFSSGPLNGSAIEAIPPVPQVQELLRRIGARGHERIRGWAAEVAMELMSLDLPGRLHA
jgi:hypothetical protein